MASPAAPTAARSCTSHKEGWLVKKAVRTLTKQSWKKRWCVLDGAASELRYYKTDKDAAPVLQLPITATSVMQLTRAHAGRQNEVMLQCGDLFFYACADTPTDASAWVRIGNEIIDSHKPAKAGPLPLPPPPAAPPPAAAPAAASLPPPPPPSGTTAGAAVAPAAAPAAVAHAAASASGGAAAPKSFLDLVKRAEERVAKAFAVGANDVGQLGIGNINNAGLAAPELLTVLKVKSQPVYVSAGHRHGAAVTGTDQLFVWGEGSGSQLGMEDMHRSVRPHLHVVLRSKRVLAVACGGSHTLAIVADAAAASSGTMTLGPLPPGSAVHNGNTGGVLMVWGSSQCGALGLGDGVTIARTPRILSLPQARVTMIAAGLVTSAAVTEGSNLYVWGDASFGRLGLAEVGPKQTSVSTPAPLQLRDAAGTALIPSHVALGGLASAFLGRSPSYPPGSPCTLFVAGLLGADVEIAEEVEDEAGAWQVAVGGTVAVRPRHVNPEAERVFKTPTIPTELEAATACIYAAAGPCHLAVVLQEASTATGGGLTGLLAAAKAAKSGGDAAPTPTKKVSVVYTAGYGFLAHEQAPSTDRRARSRIYACGTFRNVGGLLAGEDIVDVGCGLYYTYARNVWGELMAWGLNEFGALHTGKYVDLPVAATCKQPEGAHYEQYACGTDFMIGLQYPGLLGDARARALAKNAFAKWRRKASTTRADSMNANTPEGLNAMLLEAAGEVGMDEEIKGLGMDFTTLMQTLLRVTTAEQVEEAAEADANAPELAKRTSSRALSLTPAASAAATAASVAASAAGGYAVDEDDAMAALTAMLAGTGSSSAS